MSEAPREPCSYDYALVRVVPDIRTGDYVTVGAVLHARRRDFLGAAFVSPLPSLRTVDPGLLACYLGAFSVVVRGGTSAGPIGLLPASERFHWLTAVRSTVLQASALRTGLDADPEMALSRIVDAIGGT